MSPKCSVYASVPTALVMRYWWLFKGSSNVTIQSYDMGTWISFYVLYTYRDILSYQALTEVTCQVTGNTVVMSFCVNVIFKLTSRLKNFCCRRTMNYSDAFFIILSS